MKEFSERLRELFEASGWDVAELVRRTGLSRGAVSRHLNGKASPHYPIRVAYAQVFGVPIDELTRKNRADSLSPLDPNIEPYSEEKVYEIPEFDLAVAAGRWVDVSDVALAMDEQQTQRGLFRIRIRGDSMSDKYKDGDKVEFRCLRDGHHTVEVGKCYYVQRGDEATFKRLRSVDDETFTFEAINRKKYPKPFTVRRADVVRMAIALGKFMDD